MGKTKKKRVEKGHSFATQRVGELQNDVNNLACKIANGRITNKQVIYNSIMNIARKCADHGYQMNNLERKHFRQRMNALKKESFDQLQTEIEDLVHKNK